MSFLVYLWQDFKAALKMASKRKEAMAVACVWDIGEVETVEDDLRQAEIKGGNLNSVHHLMSSSR